MSLGPSVMYMCILCCGLGNVIMSMVVCVTDITIVCGLVY